MIYVRPSLRTVAVVSSAARRPGAIYAVTRTYASTPYPFTKSQEPSSSSESDKAVSNPQAPAKRPYPFTRPADPVGTEELTRPDDHSSDDSHSTSLVARDHLPRRHQPDYNVAADYRTSTFSPIPLRVMDGSEDTDTTPAAILSGAPMELQARTVRIFRPAKTPTQSGDWHGHQWCMDWDILQKGHRWENPLMGWQSSGDYMQGTKLTFKSKEDAIRFAEKQGYEYFVQEPNERRRIPKQYATQFVHIPGKLKEVRTK